MKGIQVLYQKVSMLRVCALPMLSQARRQICKKNINESVYIDKSLFVIMTVYSTNKQI